MSNEFILSLEIPSVNRLHNSDRPYISQFREMMLSSISGWITLWIDPMIYVQMFAAGIITYGIVALLEFRRVKKVPMDEALKNVE